MKIRVRYTCEGRERDYIVSPIGGGMYDTLPDYLYRRFGNSNQLRIKYCELLVLRWQVCTDERELKQEEMWARAELIKSLAVGKK